MCSAIAIAAPADSHATASTATAAESRSALRIDEPRARGGGNDLRRARRCPASSRANDCAFCCHSSCEEERLKSTPSHSTRGAAFAYGYGGPARRDPTVMSANGRSKMRLQMRWAAVDAELLRQHARLADHGHEVGVADPARHEVHVQVVLDAAAGRLPKIEPDVDPARLVRLAQRRFRSLRQHGDLVQFLERQAGERGDVAAWNHHQVSVVVGIAVEDHVGRAAQVNDEGIDTLRVNGLAS